MSRVINTESPGKMRSRLMRTCAELLRRMSQKSSIDDETKDMAAFLVLCLRQITQGVEDSAMSWEKRDYWIKAEQFRQRWSWASKLAAELETLIRQEAWTELPLLLTKLFPHFSDIKVTRFTRSPELWEGAYERLLKEGDRH